MYRRDVGITVFRDKVMARLQSRLTHWVSLYYELFWWLGAGLLIVGLAFLLWGFSKPLTVSVSTPVSYRIQGLLLYSAPVPKEVFPTGWLPTGAPFFADLTSQVTFRFLARFSTSPSSFPLILQEGRGRMWIEVEDSLGWRRQLLQEEKAWSGDYWVLQVVLPLRELEQILQQRDEIYPPVQSYRVVLSMQSDIKGEMDDMPWQETLEAQWVFSRLSNGIYVLERQDNLKLDWEGTASYEEVLPNQVTLGPWFLKVKDVRRLGLIFSLVGIALLGGLHQWLAWAHHHDPKAYFQASLGRLAIRVEPGPHLWAHGRYIRLNSLNDLVKVAQQFREPILYAVEGQHHSFLVWLPDVVYYTRWSSNEDLAQGERATAEKHQERNPMAAEEVCNQGEKGEEEAT